MGVKLTSGDRLTVLEECGITANVPGLPGTGIAETMDGSEPK